MSDAARDVERDVVVEVRGLTKSWGDTDAVVDVDFTLRRGEITGFLGHNGAGKSTSLRMLAGVLVPTRGTVRVCGHDVHTNPTHARRHIGYLPETPPVTPELTVVEQLEFAASLQGVSGKAARDAIERALVRTDLVEHRRRLVGVLSKGTRQRVGLAQALLCDPAVLLLDEPTSGLDVGQLESFRVLLHELAADRAVLFSTHVLQEVTSSCSRAILLAQGRVVVDDTLAALAARDPNASVESVVLSLLSARGGIE